MHAEGTYVRTVLHRLGHGGRKAADVGLATVACHGQRAVFDDIEYGRRDVDHLAPLGHFGLRQRQCAMAAQALRRQRMVDSLRWLGNTLERRALVAKLAAGRLARRLAQRLGLAQAIGRWRLA